MYGLKFSYLIDTDECSNSYLNDCKQICTNTMGSYLCSCYRGYRLAGTTCTGDCLYLCLCKYTMWFCLCLMWSKRDVYLAGSLVTDIDECTEGTSGCQHHCINAVGHYNCSCVEGYSLQPDGVSCVMQSNNYERWI